MCLMTCQFPRSAIDTEASLKSLGRPLMASIQPRAVHEANTLIMRLMFCWIPHCDVVVVLIQRQMPSGLRRRFERRNLLFPQLDLGISLSPTTGPPRDRSPDRQVRLAIASETINKRSTLTYQKDTFVLLSKAKTSISRRTAFQLSKEQEIITGSNRWMSRCLENPTSIFLNITQSVF